MITFLILLATLVWIVAASALYGVIVGKTVAEIRKEAVGFAWATGFAACIAAAMLAELVR